ncbi:MAG: preprotein translocase subunit SecY [Clostridiales bacterium]|nr:MAG: preprotein translocase subunit SecY [Clostridiales bacterium]
MSIFSTLVNAWKTADLKKKIVFTFGIFILFRIGCQLPVPFLNVEAIQNFFNPQVGGSMTESLLGYFNMLSGNALAQGTVFALTVQPYINASIIIQLLTVAIPYFERLQKDGGEEGKQKIKRITRWVTIGIALIQSYGYYTILRYQAKALLYDPSTNPLAGYMSMALIILLLVAGSCLVMWLGESIDEHGIGNGISMILFASIVSRGIDLLYYCIALCSGAANKNGTSEWWIVLIIVLMGLLMVTFIVFMDGAERRIPIQYAKRQVGRKMYGGQNTFLPIKVAMTGVMPIIFTFAIVGVPATIAQFLGESNGFYQFVKNYFSQTSPAYIILSFILIIAFNYFYIAIQYNPVEISNNIKNNGGTIPGIRPGKPTSDFIVKSLNKVTLFGALFLGVIAIVPFILQIIFPQAQGLAIGGTSIMILVSVALETVKKMESQMLMRHYKGFLE